MLLKEYTTSLPDGTAIHWRPLTWGEYRKLASRFQSQEGPAIWHLYDAVAGLCVIDWDCPIADELDDIPAGVIECIGEKILAESGFIPTRDLVQKQIDLARGRVQKDYYNTGVAYICAGFHMKPSEVDMLTIEEFMDYLAMAEVALGCDISIPNARQEQSVKYTEVIDPKTGKTLRVPVANQGSQMSKVEIKDGRRQQ
jgi:hypothetical protein